MSCGNYNRHTPGSCPICGVPRSATMCSSTWGHNIPCCSDKCGVAAAIKIQENESNPEYKTALKKLRKLKAKLGKMKYAGINGVDPFFEF